MSNPLVGLGPDEFTAATTSHLPRGPAWPREPGSVQSQYLAAIGDILAVFHARAAVLSERESDPYQTTELLPDLEAAYGLPDECTPLSSTLQQRRAALVAKMGADGGQSIAYYTQVALALGYAITITEFTPFAADMACELPDYGPEWKFAWQVNGLANTATVFRADLSAADEPLTVWGDSQLECIFRRIKPAHTTVIFSYT